MSLKDKELFTLVAVLRLYILRSGKNNRTLSRTERTQFTMRCSSCLICRQQHFSFGSRVKIAETPWADDVPEILE